MAATDPALGITAEFDPAQFRTAIRFAMQMGAPNRPEDRATFYFKSTGRTYTRDGIPLAEAPRTDRSGNPLDPDIEVHDQVPDPVQVDCAVKIERPGAYSEGPVGGMPETQAIVTVLDQDYDTIKDATEMRYGGDRFRFGYQPQISGLFDVDVRQLVFIAVDEN